jgi:hypothetical protein
MKQEIYNICDNGGAAQALINYCINRLRKETPVCICQIKDPMIGKIYNNGSFVEYTKGIAIKNVLLKYTNMISDPKNIYSLVLHHGTYIGFTHQYNNAYKNFRPMRIGDFGYDEVSHADTDKIDILDRNNGRANWGYVQLTYGYRTDDTDTTFHILMQDFLKDKPLKQYIDTSEHPYYRWNTLDIDFYKDEIKIFFG